MNAYSVMIVDDDIEQARLVEGMVKDHDATAEFHIDICTSLTEFDERMKRGYTPQIVLMGIVFKGEDEGSRGYDGIDAARRLLADRHGVQLIYMTSHAEYCSRVYRTDHVYLLLKPIVKADFDDALEKAIVNIESGLTRPFGVKVGGRTIRVVPSEIEYIKSERRKVRIHLTDSVIEVYESLGNIETMLPSVFIQCHKSYLVNLEKIVEMRCDGVDLVSGATIPVSQKRSRATRDAFTNYLRHRL